jgi:UrcA family protein
MNIHTVFLGAAACIGIVAGGTVRATDHVVNIAIHVNAQGLDLSQPAGERAFYTRIKNAAWAACTHGERVGLVPLDNPGKCADQALGNAIRAVALPALTRLYLASHTFEQAAAVGIQQPLAAVVK